MQNELIIAILAGLGGMIGWGFADLFAKKTIDEIGDVASLAWAHIFGTFALLVFAIYRFKVYGAVISVPKDFSVWLLLAFFGILQAIVYFFVYKGFGKGQVAVLNPVFASFSGITALLSIFIFGEIVTGHLILALVTIFFGLLLLNIDLESLKSNRFNFVKVAGFKEVALATILASLWTLFWDKFVGDQNWLSYALYMYAFMTITILVIAKLQKVNLSIKNKSVWKFLILIGLCETVAYCAISYGYSTTTRTSIIALLSGAFSLPTIIFARVFLKEKITRIQTIGSIIIIAGIILISLV